MKNKKIMILWGNVPSFLARGIDELLKTDLYAITVIEQFPSNYSNQIYRFDLKHHNLEYYNLTLCNYKKEWIKEKINEFIPDVVVAPLTIGDHYELLIKYAARRNILTIGCTDHYYKNFGIDWKRYIKMKFRSWEHFNYFWVPGYKALETLIKFGLPRKKIFTGLYSCDSNLFQQIGKSRSYNYESWPKRFLFVGNYSLTKGVDTLLNAYDEYKRLSKAPWELVMVGYGELNDLVVSLNQVHNKGGRSQTEIADIMRESGCFILPSRRDHWPIVLHEAASSGLPIIATRACGNVVEIVQENYSGLLFEPEDTRRLTDLMVKIESVANEMGQNAALLARRIDSTNWLRLFTNLFSDR
ncbi:MAG: glycosyltransferase family 4 protein [Ignavibacteriaceae bacterium]|nr:glycosyltransferase family 4 protein [Ignavibacteriaceae bacterium]